MNLPSSGPPQPATQGKPLLLVLSGPSGAGKDAVLSRMREKGYPLHYTVTATTRPRRAGEREGVDYHFLSEARFWEMVQAGGFLEWANVYGNWYGVPRDQVEGALSQGKDVILKADVQGAATLKNLAPQAVFIFLTAPMEELAARLRCRHTESGAHLARRLETAREEMNRLDMFDYVVVNEREGLDAAVAQIEAIVTAERCRVNPRAVELGAEVRKGQ